MALPGHVEQLVLDEARRTGVRIRTVELTDRRRRLLRVEASASVPAVMSFVSALGRDGLGLERLRLHRGSARTDANAEFVSSRVSTAAVPVVRSDAFQPGDPVRRAVAPPPERRQDDERRAQEQAAQAAAAEKERQRQSLISSIALTATLNNGRESLALLEVTDGGRRQPVSVRRGDAVLGAHVSDIDEARGIVVLDFPEGGRWEVRLTPRRP
jgi:hypothetical protein